MGRPSGRDYTLGSPTETAAIAAGLAEAEWYRPPVEPRRLADLTARTNRHAALHVGLYLALLVASGVWLFTTLWSWWTIPAALVYGTLYGSAADPRWHECGHGTAFRSGLVNDLVYYPASFMLLREPTLWRWSHVRHHSDTIIVGRDPEIVLPRPPPLGVWFANFLNLVNGPRSMARTVRHARGRVSAADRSYLPEGAVRRVVFEARVYVLVWAGVVVWCVVAGSAVLLLFVVGPSFYGAWLMVVLGTSQHVGLREDVLDHRLNTRTIRMNPVLRFLYWNMNFHVEHHMFPTVPTHNLAALHREVESDLPRPYRSLAAAYREIIPALLAQRHDPAHQVDREIPLGRTAAVDGDGAASLTPGARAGAFVDVCADGEIASGEVRRLDLDGGTFAVCRVGDQYFAVDGICTHSRRVHLADGLLVGSEIECPKHNGRFDIATGVATRAPASVPLETHEVRRREGRVEIRVPTRESRHA